MTNVKKLLEQQPKSLSELLPYATKKYGEEIALVADDNEYSFRLLDNMAAKVANALKFNGVNIGDRVSLLGVNSAEWLACYHGVLRIGAVINPLNSMLTSQEIEYAVIKAMVRNISSFSVVSIENFFVLQFINRFSNGSNADIKLLRELRFRRN